MDIIGWVNRRRTTVNGVIRLSSLAQRILRSGMFDGKWYLAQRPNLAGTRWPAIFHFLRRNCMDDPCRDFCSDEYLYMNPDVARAGIPAVLHYERYGKNAGRLVSLLETGKEPKFPVGAESYAVEFEIRPLCKHRTAVFASYSGNGKIEPYVLHYLRGLNEVCDNIVFVTDNPLFPDERQKLAGIVSCMLVSRHGEYDFGSYRRGWDWLCGKNLLEETEELLFCNDSCYGPFHPFGEVFEKMAERECDFWGLTACLLQGKGQSAQFFLQSFFLVFRKSVLISDAFSLFMSKITKLPEPSREHVIECYEMELTSYIEKNGFIWDSLVPFSLSQKYKIAPTYLPSCIITRYGMPLMKVKTFGDQKGDTPKKALRVAKRFNPALYADMLPHFQARLKSFKTKISTTRHPHIDICKHQDSFKEKIGLINERVATGKCIRTTFLVSIPAMFQSRSIFNAMRRDPLFETRIVVTPKIYNTGADINEIRGNVEILSSEMPGAKIVSSYSPDGVTHWRDISADSDLVFYNSPYSDSHFFYNPRFSFGRNFLPIHVNYGYFRSVYDDYVMKTDNFAYFWKAIFENTYNMDAYKHCSIIGGTNVMLAGYCKMDTLSETTRRETARKCILIAPHHSVDGGVNRVLGLSNFVRYSDFFLFIPGRYPEIDFIFRPHPVLFNVLSLDQFWGGDRVEKWCKQMRSYENVRWSDGGDYFQDFADSDGIIQDCGSFLAEYFYTAKPCCYMLKSAKDVQKKFSLFGQACLKHCYQAFSRKDILGFIDNVIVGGDDPMADSRKEFAQSSVMLNYPHASEKAVSLIKECLGLTSGQENQPRILT